MTDRKNFEALLKAYGRAVFADRSVEDMNAARDAVLATYDAAAGREGQPPVAYLYPDDLAELERVGAAMVYQERQRFSILPHQEPAMALFTHPAPKADAAADWVCVPREPTPEMMHEGACARMMSRDVGFIYARMIAASPARGGEGEKDAAMWEDEAHRLTGLIAEVVRLADSNPFCAIGHAVEHVIPHLREALTDALPPSVSEAERAAVSREAQ